MSRAGLIAFGLALCVATVARATPPPLSAYGRLPALEEVSLSPSGRYMASIGDVQGKRYILVRTLAGEVRLDMPADGMKLWEIRSVDDDHVLVTASNTDINPADWGRAEYSFTFNLDIADHKGSDLFANANGGFATYGYDLEAAYVIDGKPYAFASNISVNHPGVSSDLWRVDLSTGSVKRVAGGSQDIDEWAVGPDGKVAAYSNFYARDSTWELFRGEKELLQRTSPRQLTTLVGIGRTPGSVLVHDQSKGEDQWLEIGPDGTSQPLWPGENVTGVLRSPSTGLMIGAVIDDSSFEFFDAARQARIDAAVKPFKGRHVVVQSTTDAVDKLIVHTDGVGDSGAFYLVDLATHRADIIDNDYPEVPAEEVGAVRHIVYSAADGQRLDGVLTLPPGRDAKNLPIVMLPHGGPIGVYDHPSFDWTAQALASRGYAVFQPNYRGSGGHGAALENAGFGEFGRKMLSDIADGLAYLAGQGIVDPKRACIMGYSYGGYAALAGVTVQQGLYRCAVAVAGLSDLPDDLHWMQGRYGMGSGSDTYWRQALGVGEAGAPSLASISPARLAARADAPILLIHGTDDSVVPIEQSREMQRALAAAGKPVDMVVIKSGDHWLSGADARTATLEAAVAFVLKHDPPD